MEQKVCTHCGETLDVSLFNKSGKNGKRRGECKACEAEKRRNRRNTDPEYWVTSIVSQIWKRLYTDKDNPRNHGYHRRENPIECRIGRTMEEARSWLRENLLDEIKAVMEQGGIPSIDRIDSSKHYEDGNLRILDKVEHARLTSKEAGMVSAKVVQAIYPDGSIEEYESVSDVARHFGVKRDTIQLAIRTGNQSKKLGIWFACPAR